MGFMDELKKLTRPYAEDEEDFDSEDGEDFDTDELFDDVEYVFDEAEGDFEDEE